MKFDKATDWRRLSILVGIILSVACWLWVYFPLLPTDLFFMDDLSILSRAGLFLPPTWKQIWGLFTPGFHVDYYPIRDLSHLFDNFVLDSKPFLMRLHSLVYFGGASWGLYRLLKRLTDDPWVVALAMILWLFHPLQIEFISWISARKDLMALCFMLLSLEVYLVSRLRAGSSQFYFRVLSLILFLLSLGSKATYLLIPLLLFFDRQLWWTPLDRSPEQRRFHFANQALAIFAIVFGLFWLWVQMQVYGGGSVLKLPYRIFLYPIHFAKNVLTILGDNDSNFYYDFWLHYREKFENLWLPGVLFLLVFAFANWRLLRTHRTWWIVLSGILVSALPTSGLGSHPVLWAYRYVWIYLLGLVLLMSLFRRRIVILIVMVLLGINLVSIFYQRELWENPETIRQNQARRDMNDLISLAHYFQGESSLLFQEEKGPGIQFLALRFLFLKDLLNSCGSPDDASRYCIPALEGVTRIMSPGPSSDYLKGKLLELSPGYRSFVKEYYNDHTLPLRKAIHYQQDIAAAAKALTNPFRGVRNDEFPFKWAAHCLLNPEHALEFSAIMIDRRIEIYPVLAHDYDQFSKEFAYTPSGRTLRQCLYQFLNKFGYRPSLPDGGGSGRNRVYRSPFP